MLLRRLCPWDIGLDWPLIKHISEVLANLVRQDCKASTDQHYNVPNPIHRVHYIKSPFYIDADLPNTGLIHYTSPSIFSQINRMKFATTARVEVLDITPATNNLLGNIKNLKQVVGKRLARYSRLPFGFHKHVKITTANGRTRVTCIHQSYFDEPAF